MKAKLVSTICFFICFFGLAVQSEAKTSYIKTRCHKNEAEGKWMIYEGHQGCVGELKGALDRHKIKYDLRIPNGYHDYRIVKSELCDIYPVLVVSDVVSFYEHVLEVFLKGDCKYTRLILNPGNRFDYEKENNNFYELVRRVSQLENVFWAPNNNFEIQWLVLKNIYNFIPHDQIIVVEPYGFYTKTSPDRWPPKDLNKKVFTYRPGSFFPRFENKLDGLMHQKVEVYTPTVRYGGPDHAASIYQWFLLIPYQFSILNFFEFMSVGIIMVVPSREIWKSIIFEMRRENIVEYSLHQIYDLMTIHDKENWHQYFQYYNSRYRSAVIEFQSWDELKDWIRDGIPFDLSQIKESNKNLLAKHHEDVDRSWKVLLEMISYTVIK